MFWLQLGTLIAFNVVIFAMLFIPVSNPQHGDADDDAYGVWQLIHDIEAEREAEYTGRHRLRAPPEGDSSRAA
ncbi:hypothetical protein [Saccharopolyspora elongata]|uniref:Uncharacterized protein n=1 Tax=Saccharopolyspora elongata TaxID=2530387 RepID=A0A4R4XTJ6_9PSEU|nr:hypothetical protein [Saccharopolyspora elongata]TDD34540.1 hypothetical protein E1288_44365 [Saccharopolyspora elongata]